MTQLDILDAQEDIVRALHHVSELNIPDQTSRDVIYNALRTSRKLANEAERLRAILSRIKDAAEALSEV